MHFYVDFLFNNLNDSRPAGYTLKLFQFQFVATSQTKVRCYKYSLVTRLIRSAGCCLHVLTACGPARRITYRQFVTCKIPLVCRRQFMLLTLVLLRVHSTRLWWKSNSYEAVVLQLACYKTDVDNLFQFCQQLRTGRSGNTTFWHYREIFTCARVYVLMGILCVGSKAGRLIYEITSV
mgnify:CR=1 FL=1